MCKQWKQETEHFIQNHPVQRPFNIDTYNRVERARHSDLYMDSSHYIGFSAPQGFTQFQRKFTLNGMATGNPFLGRCIVLAPYTDAREEFKGQGALNRFWESVMEFLDLFGHHVWFLNISHARQTVHEDEIVFYRNLQNCLKRLPNLRTIGFMDTLKVKAARGQEGRENLVKLIKEQLLPTMKHLEYLRIDGEGGLPTLTEAVLFTMYGNQLQRLQMQFEGSGPSQVGIGYTDGCSRALFIIYSSCWSHLKP